MQKTIVVDSEYLCAAQDYRQAASKVHEAAEHFKRRVGGMILAKAITGKTAENMVLLLQEMTKVLRGTFKEQTRFEAALCEEYLKKINEADKSQAFSPSTKGIESMSFFEAPAAQYKEGMIMLDKAAIEECVAQLKAGPLNEMQEYLGRLQRIAFNESAGLVKEQNAAVRDKAIESLKALLAILTAYISTIESIAAAMLETDSKIAQWARATGFKAQ